MLFEKWDILDENGKSLGKTVHRNRVQLKVGEYHLVVHIWIVSKDGNFLIQRRAETKREMPGEWAANGGCATSGENSFDAARRELSEELGIFSNETSLRKILRLKRRNSLIDVWMLETDILVDELTLQATEVAEVKWVSPNELKAMIKNGEFHNYGKDYFDKIFNEINAVKGAN